VELGLNGLRERCVYVSERVYSVAGLLSQRGTVYHAVYRF